MARFVLLSGAWHAGWCWERLIPLIAAAGHSAIAPDLNGMARGQPQFAERMTIAAWADQIADLLRGEPEPVTLVGHSRSGLLISEIAERVPERVALLVYLAAFLLPDGASIGRTAAAIDRGVTPDTLEPAGDSFVRVKDGKAVPMLYNLCNAQDAAAAVDRLVPEPVSSFATPARLSADRYGTVPRAYIACTRDNAVPIDLQRAMLQALPCTPTVTLDSDHSPFFSDAKELTAALIAMAER